MPILKLLYSDEIKFIDSSKTADLIIAQQSLPTNKKPYIFLNGEPGLRNDRKYLDTLKDPYCVGSIVTSLDFDDKNKHLKNHLKLKFLLPILRHFVKNQAHIHLY